MVYYYVTSTTYFNTKLEKRKTGKPPLFSGPVLLHAANHIYVHFTFWYCFKEAMKNEYMRLGKHNAIDNLAFPADQDKAGKKKLNFYSQITIFSMSTPY